MKMHRVLSLFLTFALCAGLFTLPAQAYHVEYRKDGTPYFDVSQEDHQWWNDHVNELQNHEQGLLNYAGGANTGLISLPPEFHDGLMTMELLVDGMPYRYVDRDMNIYDLDRGRYFQMNCFSEGLAAAVVFYHSNPQMAQGTMQICYIDKQGNEVFRLDPSFCVLQYLGTYFVGYFQDGKACVIRNPRKDLRQDGYLGDYYYLRDGVEYAFIDTTGKVVTDWTLLTDMEDIVQLPLYGPNGAWIGHCMSDKHLAQNAPLYAEEGSGVTVPFNVIHPGATYGQAQTQFVGYTIDPENLSSGRGDMVILLTNNTPNWDEGDLFHLFYGLYSDKVYEGFWNIVDSTTEFLPTGDIRQIHYEIEPWGVKYLYVATPYVINEEGKLLWRGFEDLGPHWMEQSLIREARTVFLQAETTAERDKLVWFLKRAHDYPEMQLTYTSYNGVTLLGVPYPTLRNRALLDQVLAPFTSQF